MKKTTYGLALATILASLIFINFGFAAQTDDRIELTATT